MSNFVRRTRVRLLACVERLKNILQDAAGAKSVLPCLVVLSFLESVIIPVPLEALLVPLMLQNREKIWQLSLAATVGCLAGAMTGYGVGAFFFDAFSEQPGSLFSTQEQWQDVIQKIRQHGFIYILFIGVTPVPFQVAMIAAGAIQYSFILFILATVIARGLRYFGLGVLIYYFGPSAIKLIKKYRFAATVAVTLIFLFVIVNLTIF